ncbi:TatD family hydrolase [Desulfoluna sp.]|uniref:TatD family hydrolase n=1 Tax=Desulfoluna sp. TaxID=2045199 RepID=UPI002634F624|nr:TatD family hydrolase [Desulfoluna sp.]
MKLFDTHAHLQDPRLAGVVDAMMDRARAIGVSRILSCGTREDDWAPLTALAARYPEILPAYGVHPWFIETLSPDWVNALGQRLTENRAAVGEIGLDFVVEGLDRGKQEAVFLAQLRLARALKRPVSIHCRKAWGRLMDLLKQEGGLPHGGAIHSFSGSMEVAQELVRLGAFLSFSGSITRPNNHKAKKNAAAVPPDRLLIETDSPDILPENLPGPLNEPAHVIQVVTTLATVRKTTPESVAEMTWNNALGLFGDG